MTYSPATDLRGNPLVPGDYVSSPLYPRGTIRGVVVISERVREVQPDGSTLPSLALDVDGEIYSLSGRARKLRGVKA